MSKIVLFVCLVLLGIVYANTQIRVVNAQYDVSSSTSPGLVANLNDFLNITTLQSSTLYGAADDKLEIPASGYQTVPIYSFVVGSPITVSVYNAVNYFSPPITADASVENITLVENQSYSFIYIATSNDQSDFSNYVTLPTMLLPFEERPNPSPYGKALLRIVNIAVSTYDAESMVVNVTAGGVSGNVTLGFGEASDFLAHDSALNVTLDFSLPIENGGFSSRTLSLTTVVNTTTVVYIRGDIGQTNQLGSLITAVDFAFPAAPTPVAPPTAQPVSEPVADTPTVPAATAPTAPTTPTAHTPTKKVSSAAQTVAQIAGVAAVASLLF